MEKNHLYIYFLILASFAFSAGCSDPVAFNREPEEVVIKTKTKYLLDIKTFQIVRKINCETYSEDGKLIKYEEFNDFGSLIIKQSYTYIDNRRIDSIFKINQLGNQSLKNTTVVTFNKEGDISSKMDYNDKGEIEQTTTFEYDFNGNCFKKIITDNRNGSKKTMNYDFKYNDKGLLIKRLEYNNGELVGSQSYDYNDSHTNISISSEFEGNDPEIIEYTTNSKGLFVSEIRYNYKHAVIAAYKYEYLYYTN